MPLVAVYDANVLYPSTLRDLLIRAAIAGLVQARWSEEILDETFRNLKANRPDLSPENLDRTRTLMGNAIRDANVEGYQHLTTTLELPDPEDRHVLAAAITCGAEVIVTKNLRDFPAERLAGFEIEAMHPDAFLLHLAETSRSVLTAAVAAIARTWPEASSADVLRSLAREAPQTAKALTASPDTA